MGYNIPADHHGPVPADVKSTHIAKRMKERVSGTKFSKKSLSPNAKAALATFFGMWRDRTLAFNTPSKRTPECVAALEELTVRGLVTARYINLYPVSPIEYKATDLGFETANKITKKEVEKGSFYVTKD